MSSKKHLAWFAFPTLIHTIKALLQSGLDGWTAYKLRIKRRRLLLKAWRKSYQLTPILNQTSLINDNDILLFVTVRNELQRLPFFFKHHRALGICHFIVVDNDSSDGTLEYLKAQPDISIWHTAHSYKLSRFGIDWITWLMIKYGHGHWCLTLDADEILIYPHWTTRPLPALTKWLEQNRQISFGAMMLDMYPKGRIGQCKNIESNSPFDSLKWFDHGNYTIQKKPILKNLWTQGGPRARCFFPKDPQKSPTLNKIPLIRWNRRFAYVSSTHSALPRKLNKTYDEDGGTAISGILLHSKFLPQIVTKSKEERQRKEHFQNSELYEDYYQKLISEPDLWCAESTRFLGWRHLETLGLMSKGGWV